MPVDAADAVRPKSPSLATRLLRWYDANARTLAWRVPPGAAHAPDPYRVWLSEVMLQQTTVAAATPFFERFVARWPDVAALAAADEGELMAAWAGLGYYARARNLIACARAIVADHGGRFPDSEAGLRALPGIGAYTAAAVAAIAFGRAATVVDGNVERVVARLFAVDAPLPAARPRLRALAATLTPAARAGDFAQATMDLGATVCTPRAPRCPACPLAADCAAAAGDDPARYPLRAAKAVRPTRRGIAYWLAAGDDVLLVRRPPRGLLGGMRALPGGAWGAEAEDAPPAPADWHAAGTVGHVFTHFALALDVRAARVARRSIAGDWWPAARIAEAGLPTLYTRAAALGIAALDRRVAA